MRLKTSSDAAIEKDALAPLERLPVELQLKILQDLVIPDLDDPQTVLRHVAAFRRTSRPLHQVTESEFSTEKVEGNVIGGNRRITSLIKRLGQGIKGVDEIERRIYARNREESIVENIAMNADFIAFQTADKRHNTVSDVLKRSHIPIKRDSVESLIFNIDYIDPRRSGSGIVKYVCDVQREYGGAEDLVKKLIERAEHLTAEDVAFLAETSCGIDANKRRECLNAWAGRTHLLANHHDELNVLSRIYEDGDGKGYSLGLFAKNISKLSPDNRPLLIRNITKLPYNDPGRMWAMSQVAANLSYLGEAAEPLRRKVTRDILGVARDILGDPSKSQSERSQSPGEHVPEGPSQWHTEPTLCLIEAVHHLSSHRILLDDKDIQDVKAHIEKILNKKEVEAYPAQAQLISHMSENQRRNFVGNALKTKEPTDVAPNDIHEKSIGVILALTLRVKDLLPEEKQIYVDHVCRTKGGHFVEEALRYNFNEQLRDFKGGQRTDLVNERLRYFVRTESAEAVNTLLDIAQNAKFLKAHDISNVIKTAKDQANRAYGYSDSNDPMINSFAGIAARALVNWSREVLSNGRSPRRLDDRSSERSSVR
ncbi:hypothetical protein [Ensifer sp. NM-2]|uniref:hypothetical protein n=1 Tax=Ensifer sp. NM-2 TaxID=2109730 RepID=UPI000D11F641|nr:hypothetical protein [Ensifer sp. NM-2]